MKNIEDKDKDIEVWTRLGQVMSEHLFLQATLGKYLAKSKNKIRQDQRSFIYVFA